MTECVQLLVKDIDFDYQQITVKDGKGGKDRITVLPESVIEPLKKHIRNVIKIHEKDIDDGYDSIYMPYALEHKYPSAGKELGWHYLFPSKNISTDPRNGVVRRHHIHESVHQRAVKQAVIKAVIRKHGGCHTFRHSFATHLLEDETDIRTVQGLSEHNSSKITEIYAHVSKSAIDKIRNPIDDFFE